VPIPPVRLLCKQPSDQPAAAPAVHQTFPSNYDRSFFFEGKVREGAGIRTRREKKEELSILRDRKSEFERMTDFVIIDSVASKVD
jgi:hypothetical protein